MHGPLWARGWAHRLGGVARHLAGLQRTRAAERGPAPPPTAALCLARRQIFAVGIEGPYRLRRLRDIGDCAGSIPSKGWALACLRAFSGSRASSQLCAFHPGQCRRRCAICRRDRSPARAQTYTQFDLVTGELGRPTAPVQPPLYWQSAASSRRLPHRQRLIDCRHDLAGGQLIETLAVAVEPALAAFQLARQAWQRILHQPDIAALLDGAGGGPGLIEPADAATVPTAADRSGRKARPSALRSRRQGE